MENDLSTDSTFLGQQPQKVALFLQSLVFEIDQKGNYRIPAVQADLQKAGKTIKAKGHLDEVFNSAITHQLLQKLEQADTLSFASLQWHPKSRRENYIPSLVFEIRKQSHSQKHTLTVKSQSIPKAKYTLLENINANLKEGIYRYSEDKGFIYVNKGFQLMFNYNCAKELLGQHPSKLYVHEEDRKVVVKELLEKGFIANKELHLKKTDGSTFYAVINSTLSYDEDGKPFIDGAISDISAQKKYQSEIRESKALYKAFVQDNSTGIFFLSLQEAFNDEKSIAEKVAFTLNNALLKEYNQTFQYQYRSFFDKELENAKKKKLKAIWLKHEFLEEVFTKFFTQKRGLTDCIIPLVGKQKKHYLKVNLNAIERTSGDLVICGTLSDVTDDVRIEKKLELQNAYYQQLFDVSPLGIIRLGYDGTIEDANKAFEKMFGFPKNEIIGQQFDRVLVPQELRKEAERLSKICLGKEIVKVESSRKRKDGSLVDVLIVGCPIIIGGSTKGAYGIYTDISDHKCLENALRKAKKEADDANKAKSLFLSSMSHEIRTPLNAIVGLTDLLIAEVENPELLNTLENIKISSDSLLDIINDILDMSKIEAGKLSINSTDFSLKELLYQNKRMFQRKCEEKNLEFHLTIADDFPDYLIGDSVRINQVMINLIGNALKFTEKGHIHVKAEIIHKGTQKLHFKISIIDTGIGVNPKEKDKLFDLFSQLNNQQNRYKPNGTGLGLAISQRLIKLQDGKIGYQDNKNEGSTFFFTLNLPYMEKPTSTSKDTKNTPKNLKNMHILVAEDNIMNQLVIKKILSKWNAQVSIAQDGKETVDLIKENIYDLLILDLQMPVMDGFEVMDFINKNPDEVKNKTMPVIALTADAFEETKKKVMNSGMKDFITKPIDQENLYKVIQNHCAQFDQE